MKDYFRASIQQHIRRGEHLLGRIPKPTQLPDTFHGLLQTCNRELETILHEFESLLKGPMLLEKNQPERLRRFRRAVQQMSLIESTCVAALSRHDAHDTFLSHLVKQITHEISYPLLAPSVTSLSQNYFHIYPFLNLLFVPLSEGSFLLHLPDLYHELGHPLVTARYNPHLKPFQYALWTVLGEVMQYVKEEKQKENRSRGPQGMSQYLNLWERSWIDWSVEFFCDLFAIYTCGPAFAWSHLHLCAKSNEQAYRVPLNTISSHPADHARMQVMLHGLRMIGFESIAQNIEKEWQALLVASGATPEPEYLRCFPDALLESFAIRAYEGIHASDFKVVSPSTDLPIYNILNQAWEVFWQQPDYFPSWEQNAVTELRKIADNIISPLSSKSG